MQFTPEILLEQAQLLTDREVDRRRGVLAVYLRGSLLYGSPLLGGAGDIDLVFIHHDPPEIPREIQPLTPEIHFDLVHHDQAVYSDHLQLRVDPWLGPALRDAQPLHDPRHFFDYTQSGVRGRFAIPETVEQRARPQLKQARQFWMERQLNPPLGSIGEIQPFLNTLQQSVNALALLSRPPLPIRRLGLEFPELANRLDPELLPAFLEALGADQLSLDQLESWYSPWIAALGAEKPDLETDLLSQQIRYLGDAVQTLLDDRQSLAALWPLLVSWTQAVQALPGQHALRGVWREACGILGLSGNDFHRRLEALDRFLDRCETLFARQFDQQDWA
jgi:hypothetical protein